MRPRQFYTFTIILITLLSSTLYAESPEIVLNSRDIEATIYLSAVHRAGGEIRELEWSWIPSDIAERCENNSPAECAALDHCMSFPTAQKCNKDWSRCEPYVIPECQKYGLTLDAEAHSKRRGTPYKLFTVMTVPSCEDLTEIVRELELSPTELEFGVIRVLTRKQRLHALLHFEECTNGAQVRLVKILPQKLA